MTLAGLLLGLGLAYAAGGLFAWRLWPGREKPALLLAALAWPAGLALTSSAYFLWMSISGGRAAWYPWLEVVALAAASWFVRGARRVSGDRLVLPRRPKSAVEATALVVLALVVACALLVVLRYDAASPRGYWDAWARINLKARFLHAGGPEWTWIFRGDGVPHPDYPLLLECSVARLAHWSGWSGGVELLPARVLSVLGWLACSTTLLALVGHLRSPFLAAAAGIVLLCNRTDISWAATQYADFALATYFTWSAGLLVLATRGESSAEPWWPLVAFCVGSAAWCKDEGLAFAALVSAAALVAWISRGGRRWQAATAWAAGLLLGGGSVLVLKLGYSWRSSVFGARESSIWQDLTDPARYRVMGDYLLGHVRFEMAGWTLLPIAVALLLLPRERELRRSWLPCLLCAGTGLVFFLVMITTREDLDWHVGTTIERLVLHLWPTATLGAMVVLKSRE